MSTNVKFSKTQISEKIQSGGFFGFQLANLGKKAPANVAIYLPRDDLPGLVSKLPSDARINLKEKYEEQGLSQLEKDLHYLFGMKM